ncbi:hypothetical protein ACCQ23_10005 [Xanthomonas axonopodis pv. phyllanthi]|uniref:hypothetical protein n=1 Tax=Xanthomonas axonopodis TaxID=53413 RepID=UPI003557B883
MIPLGRSLGRVAFWLGVLIAVTVAVNVLGIRLLGYIYTWNHWLRAYVGYFFAWRIMLYTGAAWVWRRLLTRLHQHGTSIEDLARACRIEVAAVLAILLLEASHF